MSRPTWDNYFLELAKAASTRATCLRAKHGCILVRDNNPISTGYNGSPPGFSHCSEEGCLMLDGHCVRCNHAEMNAICLCESSTKGAIAYVTGPPCLICIRLLLCSGITKIVCNKNGHYAYPPVEQAIREYLIKTSKIDYVEIDLSIKL